MGAARDLPVHGLLVHPVLTFNANEMKISTMPCVFHSSYSEMYSMSIFILCYCHFNLGDSSDRGSVEATETV